MVVPYYDQTKVKLDLRITDSALDTQLDNWGDEAEAEINSMLTDVATKNRRITSLPVLPYAAGSVPEQVQGAADNYVKSKYYGFTKNMTLDRDFKRQSDLQVARYIEALQIDRTIYYRIAR